jgi:hypothetical protein
MEKFHRGDRVRLSLEGLSFYSRIPNRAKAVLKTGRIVADQRHSPSVSLVWDTAKSRETWAAAFLEKIPEPQNYDFA